VEGGRPETRCDIVPDMGFQLTFVIGLDENGYPQTKGSSNLQGKGIDFDVRILSISNHALHTNV
jgi:hypothetical protein